MKVLIFGCGGYIGTELNKQLEALGHETIGITTDPKNAIGIFCIVEEVLHHYQPDWVVNCIADTGGASVENCEYQKGKTIDANIIIPKILAEVCAINKYRFAHFSTGCMYNGYTLNGWKEKDTPTLSFGNNNCCFYTGTKVLAEDLLKSVPHSYIWRIRLPFESQNGHRNYISKLLKHPKLVNAANSISHKEELVKACIECMVKEVPMGTYHITNQGGITAKEITNLFRKHVDSKREFEFFESLESFNAISNIPRSNTILNTDKLAKTGIIMRPVMEAMEETLKQWKW